MKLIRITLSVVAAFILLSAFSIKKEKKDVYAFGLSASFTDAVVYYTNIQVLDSVQLDKKGFLPKRNLYAYQLKNHLEYNRGEKNRTSMIYFSDSKKKLEKEFSKIINKYKKDKTITLKMILSNEFTFIKPED